ncbi:MAG: phosphoglycerate kinase [Patescibacteria group bacterium]|nr:phosphoglycerate kinase [Patescibacteria group bacterium]MDD5164164.1 phosphoglycerate kinase [Patescibacteria group bacterium]MDD5534502.1 phosphoglycerate kinase [Patescibacteria group bacterium]
MKLKTIKEIKNLKGKRVLVRVDFNCPIKNGRVIDDTRIQASLETIKYLIQQKAIIILISHLGDPKGKKNLKYSLKPVYKNLSARLCERIRSSQRGCSGKSKAKNLKFINDCVGGKVKKEIATMRPGEIILLENLRFYVGEEKNDLKFAKQLSELADLYINDAFSVCHRAHASVSAISRYLPVCAGFSLIKEIENLNQVLTKPTHPFVVLMGGIKISTKIKPIKNLAKKADQILIGGALANNFLKIKGINIGVSFYEPAMLGVTRKLLKNKKIILPLDTKIKGNGDNFRIFDMGPKTVALFQKYLKTAKTIVWNGPMGFFEEKPFDQGTREMVRIILNNRKAKIIIGGGETIAAFKNQSANWRIKIKNNIFISTGGGAMLEFLEGKILPGIKPLIN